MRNFNANLMSWMSCWVYYSDRIIIYCHYCKFVDECPVVLHNAVFLPYWKVHALELKKERWSDLEFHRVHLGQNDLMPTTLNKWSIATGQPKLLLKQVLSIGLLMLCFRD